MNQLLNDDCLFHLTNFLDNKTTYNLLVCSKNLYKNFNLYYIKNKGISFKYNENIPDKLKPFITELIEDKNIKDLNKFTGLESLYISHGDSFEQLEDQRQSNQQ